MRDIIGIGLTDLADEVNLEVTGESTALSCRCTCVAWCKCCGSAGAIRVIPCLAVRKWQGFSVLAQCLRKKGSGLPFKRWNLGIVGPAYRYQGCYDDTAGPYFGGDRTLPQMYDNLRSGVGIDECAAAAGSRGFPVFALQGKGQCFFGSMADVARLQASQNLSDDRCSSLPCPASAATCLTRINKVYFLIGVHTPLRSCPRRNVLTGM
jgi:hypothetical protein